MSFQFRIIAVIACLSTLAACGQKGPLFLAPQSVPYSLLPGPTAGPTVNRPSTSDEVSPQLGSKATAPPAAASAAGRP